MARRWRLQGGNGYDERGDDRGDDRGDERSGEMRELGGNERMVQEKEVDGIGKSAIGTRRAEQYDDCECDCEYESD